MSWFIACLDRAIDGADLTLAKVLRKARIWEQVNSASTNERQQKIVARLLDDFKGNLNTSKYAKIAKCSTDTALRDIRQLVERGILLKISEAVAVQATASSILIEFEGALQLTGGQYRDSITDTCAEISKSSMKAMKTWGSSKLRIPPANTHKTAECTENSNSPGCRRWTQ